jgi:protein-glutamine gamma-glutamyltransferase
LEDFLFGAKEGHCEHFASALAILLRMEGIPARIVTGFVAREKNETGNYYIVRGRDAHSWVEARVNGAWRTYDPSPAETFAAPERTVFKLLREKVEHLNFLWNAHVLGYDLDAQQKVAGAMTGTTRSLNHKLARLFRPPPERKDSAPAGSVRVWFWIGAAVLLTALGAALRRAPQGGERSRRGDEPEQVRLYRDLLGWLAKHGWTRRAAETPREFAERLAGFQTPEWQRDFRRLTEGYYSARFAGRFASAEELSVLRSTARRLRSRS